MAGLLNELKDHFMNTAGNDPRTAHLPLVKSYSQVIILLAAYVLLVKKIGPAFMAKRPPYQLKSLIIVYNFIQVIWNFIMFVMMTRYYVYNPKYNWKCMAIDQTDVSNDTLMLRAVTYSYFLNKISDCIDTIFFVLTKKFSHVSILHVYHHALMVWAGFAYLNLLFGSQFTVVGHINTLIHTVLYIYYLVAALGFKINVDFWKPLITKCQIAQFMYIFLSLFISIFNNWCNLPKAWQFTLAIQNFTMVVLFSNFYYQNYIRKKPSEKTIKKK